MPVLFMGKLLEFKRPVTCGHPVHYLFGNGCQWVPVPIPPLCCAKWEITTLHEIRKVIYIFIRFMRTGIGFSAVKHGPGLHLQDNYMILFRNLKRREAFPSWRLMTCQIHLIPTQSRQPLICTLPVTCTVTEPNKAHYLRIPPRRSSVLIC